MKRASSGSRRETKLAVVLGAMSAGDWDRALRLAGRFPDLGEHAAAIRLARDAIVHPEFYEALGRNVESLRAEGIEALKERYERALRAFESESESA